MYRNRKGSADMLENYLIVHKSIVPDYFEKVLAARHMLETGKAKDVSQAVKLVGISRSTYYKYKDFIMEPSELSGGRKAVISVLLDHEPGVLSALLARISEVEGSILTITQSLPIHDHASVTISMDISNMTATIPELIDSMANTPGVENPKLVAIE